MAAKQKKWIQSIRKNIARGSCQKVVAATDSDIKDDRREEEEEIITTAGSTTAVTTRLQLGRGIEVGSPVVQSPKEIAAVRIQACFRGHLARRAFRALRSLVKLQALVRGAHERKQAQITTQCMQALIKLQVKMRARKLLNDSKHAK